MAEEDADVILRIDGQEFDTATLTYKERRDMKRIIKLELWDEEVDGEWVDFNEPSIDDYITAAALVFIRRGDPNASIDQALACNPKDMIVEDPPTKPEESEPDKPARKPRARASATSGTQS